MRRHRCAAALSLWSWGLLFSALALAAAGPDRPPDPTTASRISWAGTLVPGALGVVAMAADRPEIGWTLVSTGVVFGPAGGYFYGKRPGRGLAGAGTRAGFATLGVVGMGLAFDETGSRGAVAFLVGGVGVLVSTLWDLLAVRGDVGTRPEERRALSRAPFHDFVPPEEPPADAGDATMAARVFDRWIAADALGGAELPVEVRASRLAGVVWSALVQRYMEEEGIEAAPEEIEAFRRAPTTGGWIPAGAAEDSVLAARAAVMQWKLNRSLYRRYGGDVVRTSLDPLAPVGAYRDFLWRAEARGVFEIRDAELRWEFWRRFSEHPKDKVPPRRVRFEAPWWLPEDPGAAPAPHRR